MIDLVQIIKDNPGCTAIIDNDYWSLHRVHPHGPAAPNEDAMSYAEFEAWQTANEIACSDSEILPVDGQQSYGAGNCYGQDILLALAAIAGVNIDTV